MEAIKFALFLAMEIFVVAIVMGALILGLWQIVTSKVKESRKADFEISPRIFGEG
jgi:hypothetical protein